MQRVAVMGWFLGVVIGMLGTLSGPMVFAKSLDDATIQTLGLRDIYGQAYAGSEWEQADIVVVAFLGTECPLAKLYGPRLQAIHREFSKRGVALLGVFSNIQDSLTEVQAYQRQAGIEFPLVIDAEQRFADLLKAERTPEVMVFDAQRTERYRGRIDDQYAISVSRKEPTQRELANVLSKLVAGEEIEVTSTSAVGCLIGRRARVEPHGDITYSQHIAAIFNRRCVECHRKGEIAPFPMTSYDEIKGWEAMIAEVIDEGRMPPWFANPAHGEFKNDARLTPEEKKLIATWIENGAPEGNRNDLPPPPTFVPGWRMPEPDLVIYARDNPFQVPATGTVDYQYFTVDPQFTEDKYICAAEARPGNTAVVHHIIAFILEPGEKKPGLGKMLIGYAPGTSPLVFPPHTAIRVPAGSRLVFELHYTPNGTPQSDRSCIGLKFTDASAVENQLVGFEAANSDFRIPPEADRHVVEASETFRQDVSLLSLTPHMHLRGKSFRYDAHYPDGRVETLLDVPRYDFNWQLRYEFAEPKSIPKGTVVRCTAAFDNSSGNPNNPDPQQTVTWGQQSWDEMMIGFFTAVRPAKPSQR